MSWRAAIPLLPAVLLLAACGNSRLQPRSVASVAPPSSFRVLSYPRSGVRVAVPGNWVPSATHPPLLALVSSGPAIISLWRYPAAAVPPAGTTALAAARRSLLQAARARDPHLSLLRSSLVNIDGNGAVVLYTLQRFRGGLRKVISMHVYAPGSEVVLEEYAPPAAFGPVDRSVFSPVMRSLHLIPAHGP